MSQDKFIDYFALLQQKEPAEKNPLKYTKFKEMQQKHFLEIDGHAHLRPLFPLPYEAKSGSGYAHFTHAKFKELSDETLKRGTFDFALYRHPEKVGLDSVKELEEAITRLHEITRNGYLVSARAKSADDVPALEEMLRRIGEGRRDDPSFYHNGNPEIIRCYFAQQRSGR